MSHRTAPRLFLIVLAALALFVTSCGGGSSSGDESSASKSSGSSDKADTSKTTKPADDKCPAETTYEITGPDGAKSFTAAAAYAYESSGYLSVYLFSKDFKEDEVQSISTGFRTDDPGTIFTTLHTRGDGSEVAPITTGTYVADSPEAQKALEAGKWVTDVAVSLGLDPIASGFPADPSTKITIDVIDDEKICGTITHPAGTATFRADHLVSGS